MRRHDREEASAASRWTPYAKAAAGTSFIFAAALIATMLLCIATSRSGVERQLGSQAQETATGLAKALEGAMHDKVMVDTVVTVLFDRGQFASISVVASNGRMLAFKELPPAVPGVPDWFQNLVALDAPASEAMVTQHWRQLGRVIVTSHPRFAYLQLWHTLLGILAVLMTAYLAMLGLLWRHLAPEAAEVAEKRSDTGKTHPAHARDPVRSAAPSARG